MLALIVLLLVAGFAFVIGSRPRVPPPFGLARNGLVTYAKDGDIYTADPVSGTAKAVVTGPETDLHPVWSLDGTRFVFERKQQGSSGPGSLFVAKPDGSDLTRVTQEPLAAIGRYSSPDGQGILTLVGPVGGTSLLIAKSNGSGVRTLTAGTLTATEPAYRPPDGSEIAFVGFAAPFVDTGAAAILRPRACTPSILTEPVSGLSSSPRTS